MKLLLGRHEGRVRELESALSIAQEELRIAAAELRLAALALRTQTGATS